MINIPNLICFAFYFKILNYILAKIKHLSGVWFDNKFIFWLFPLLQHLHQYVKRIPFTSFSTGIFMADFVTQADVATSSGWFFFGIIFHKTSEYCWWKKLLHHLACNFCPLNSDYMNYLPKMVQDFLNSTAGFIVSQGIFLWYLTWFLKATKLFVAYLDAHIGCPVYRRNLGRMPWHVFAVEWQNKLPWF